MRGIAIICVVLCMSAGCSSARPFAKKEAARQVSEQETQFELARAQESEGQLAKAEATLRELCAAKPNDPQYRQRLGVVLTRLGQRPAGIAELEQAHLLATQNTHIINDLGYAYLQSGDSAKAIEMFRKTLAIDPQDRRANNNLALAVGYDGDLKESYRLFQSTVTEAEALSNLGYLAAQNGKTDLAIKAYSRVLTLEPDRKSAAEALTQLALLNSNQQANQSIATDLNNSEVENANEAQASKHPVDQSVSRKTVQNAASRDSRVPVRNAVATATASKPSVNEILSEASE